LAEAKQLSFLDKFVPIYTIFIDIFQRTLSLLHSIKRLTQLQRSVIVPNHEFTVGYNSSTENHLFYSHSIKDLVMARYIFLPIPTPEQTTIAHQIIKACKDTGNDEPKILRNYYESGFGKSMTRTLGGGCLRKLSNTDELWFLVHGTGSAGARTCGAERHLVKSDLGTYVENTNVRFYQKRTVWKAYTPPAVAKLLLNEGLPKGFKNLHMLNCGGGLRGNDNTELSLPYAERVQKALKALGYGKLKVTGYLGSVRGGRQSFVVHKDSETLDPHEASVTFG
jgi:hypothetical protein